jgi:hypothetical protein
MQAPEPGHPDVAGALQAVAAAAGLPDLGELLPPQREMLIGLIRMGLHQAADLLDSPGGRPLDVHRPAILQGWGRGSAVSRALWRQRPELAACGHSWMSARASGCSPSPPAGVWPEAAIVGIDTWGPALDAAIGNVRAAGLADRISHPRPEDVTASMT